MSKIPMLERFAAQSLVEHEGELIFSKEKFAELIVKECAEVSHSLIVSDGKEFPMKSVAYRLKQHFGVEE
ncbi:MAG: hypothetical protein EBU90_16235 [Proteobacteria bacterium]|nr:hypothetical protein [Pseudomonadota bacterium]